MTAALVLNRFGLSSMFYPEWLEGMDVYMITEEGAVTPSDDLSNYTSVLKFSEYLNNPEVEIRALELHKEVHFDEVIALSEFDLIRAARLRKLMGVEGQDLESATAYRDKFRMKSILRSAGIPVADFRKIDAVDDLLAFAEQYGFPLVVKPRRGAGSLGVRVVENFEELCTYAALAPEFRSDGSADLLAEVYIPHELLHVDGAVFENKVIMCWPSHATYGLAFHGRTVNRCTMFEPQDPMLDEVRDLVERTLVALPTPRVSIFHAEVFATADGELIVNEIASRMGGGRIKTMLHAAFGINLEEWYVRNAWRHGSPVLSDFPAPLIGAFSLYPPPEDGVLTSAPTECSIPGVFKFRLEVPIGAQLNAPTSISDVIGSATAVASSANEVCAVLDRVDEWFLDSIVIDPGAQA